MNEEVLIIERIDNEKSKRLVLKSFLIKTYVWLFILSSNGKSKYRVINFFNFYFFSKQGIQLFTKGFGVIITTIIGFTIKSSSKLSHHDYILREDKKNELIPSRYLAITPIFHVFISIDKIQFDLLTKTLDSMRLDPSMKINAYIIALENPQVWQKDISLLHKNYSFLSIDITDKDKFNDTLLKKLTVSESASYYTFIEQGDLFSPRCFSEVTSLLNEKYFSLFYSNEDSVTLSDIYRKPYRKPLLTCKNIIHNINFAGGALFIDAKVAIDLPVFHSFFDVLLRITEVPLTIQHSHKILFHKRVNASKNIDNLNNQLEILKDTIQRRKIEAELKVHFNKGNAIEFIYPMVEFPLVSIIIPTKNQYFLLKQCIDSILTKSTYPSFEIIVVDNGSTEQSFFDLIEEYKKESIKPMKIIRHDFEFNFSELINVGALHAEGEHLILLNNDTKVVTPDWIEKLLSYSSMSHVGAVGAKLLYPDNTIQHAGIDFDLNNECTPYHCYAKEDSNSLVNGNSVNTLQFKLALTGACIMVKKALFEELKGFDPLFPVDFNDIDFCLKSVSVGYENIYNPFVELYHYESFSRGRTFNTVGSYKTYITSKGAYNLRWSEFIQQQLN